MAKKTVQNVEVRPAVESPDNTDLLLQMQEEAFGPGEDSKEEVIPEPKETPEPVKTKAEQIFEKTTEANKNLNGKQPEPKEKEVKPPADDFIDVLEFGAEKKPEPKEPIVPPVEVDLDKENNIKNLRKVAGDFKTERDQLRTKVTELEERVSSVDAAAFQNQITQLTARVKELEPYELTFGLHKNPEFKRKFIDGEQIIVGEMKEILSSYNAEEESLEAFLLAANKREENEILADILTDPDARAELRTLKRRRDGLLKERQNYEKAPDEALRQFREAEATNAAMLNQKRDLLVDSLIETGWETALSSLTSLPADQRLQELVEVPGKKEHNEKIVRPILEAARREFLPIMNYIEMLIRKKAVPSESFAIKLAALCQQAVAGVTVSNSRRAIYKAYQELLQERESENKVARPGVKFAGRTEAPVSNGKVDPAAAIFAEVMEETAGLGKNS